jgi:hypothetical protein
MGGIDPAADFHARRSGRIGAPLGQAHYRY